MTPSFNLLDEPWLPVRFADGGSANLGLLDVFRRSGEVVALADTAPPNLVAQYRLLLAILHRGLSREHPEGWKDKDRARWYKEGFPVDKVCRYLEHWRDRFWLFHSEYPFMQVAALATAEETREKRKPWTQISLGSACCSTPLVFDHAIDAEPSQISAAEALRNLLGFLQCTPGGLVKTIRTSDKGGALANTAALVAMGSTLAQTLMLNLHPAPSGGMRDGAPSWEGPALTVADLKREGTLATGINDRYTRQSRAVLFSREDDGSIRWLRFAAGFALLQDTNAPDPMASFRASKDKSSWISLTFNEGKSLWRDLPTLLPASSEKANRPAATLEWAIRLQGEEECHQVFLVAGLSCDQAKQAKLLRWRSEYMVLPIMLLKDEGKIEQLRDRVAEAEGLYSDLRNLGEAMIAETLPKHKDTRSHADRLFGASLFPTYYFSTVERALPKLLEALGEGRFPEAYTLWQQVLLNSAKEAWRQLLVGLGTSPRVLRADAKFQRSLHHKLKKYTHKEES